MEGVSRERLWAPLVLVALLAVAGLVVDATVFAYRALSGGLSAVVASGSSSDVAQYGASCAGFYVAPNGLYYDGGVQALPPAGSNANSTFATIGSGLGVRVDLSGVACSWSDAGGSGTTYLTATASINVTTGTWYIKDLVGFGYPAFSTPSPVYLYIKVEDALAAPGIAEAKLILYDAKTRTRMAECNIMASNTVCGPVTLAAGTGLQIDLWLNATGSATDSFRLGFSVATAQESPR